ncbi:molybdopterin synthase catalytic subunit [Sphingomonas panacisoli]|uniref:Molybdopterin synthase catalytic subunit n=1 Tax=Sphingomonas panacisoli TaxID=1813879 RepID=A0A5B8LHL8_9SPHN|nr:molybdenum cofactor biosynthesis protein MoaE [Sphingomonas panacisoli]QDZ07114.1 molybdopterin synthase catalytic subunit [Sphingomonas panacisoli]
MIRVVVSKMPLDVAAETAALHGLGGGAVATFTGLVRGDDGVGELLLEHYPGATKAALEKLAAEAVARWELAGAIVIHRVGAMKPGEPIVFVAACAAHRAPALEACGFLIDRLKTDAPFWKRETRGEEATWLGERAGDHEAAERWR